MKNIIAVSSNTYHKVGVDVALEGIAAAGFNYVELTAVEGWTEHIMADMLCEEKEKIKNKMKSLGLECVALSGHCNLMEKERLNDFKANIALAKDLGCSIIVSSTGEAHFGEGEVFKDDVLVQNIKSLIPELKQAGLTLVLENHGQFGTGQSLKTIVDKVGSDLVGINYDTGNVVLYGNTLPYEDIKTCVNEVKFAHLKDKIGDDNVWNFPALGEGNIGIERTVKTLIDNGYDGIFSVELEFTEEFTMSETKEGDLEFVNKELKKSYDYLKSIGLL